MYFAYIFLSGAHVERATDLKKCLNLLTVANLPYFD